MRGGQSEEAVPPLAEDRQDFGEFVVAPDIVESAAGQRHRGAEDQGHLRVRRDPGLQQLVAVGGELQQGRHLRVAGELGVEHGVAAVGLPDQEIGAAVELAVEEGRLEHDVGARAQGVNGLGMLGRQGGAVHGCRPGRRRTRRARWPDPSRRTRHERVQDPVLVDVTQLGGVLEHLIVFERGLGGAAQFLVELPQQLVLALAAMTRSLAEKTRSGAVPGTSGSRKNTVPPLLVCCSCRCWCPLLVPRCWCPVVHAYPLFKLSKPY